LWFSLQLTLNRAEQLCNAFAGERNDFAALVNKTFRRPQGEEEKAVMIAPTSHAALRFAIEVAKAELGRCAASHGSSNFPEAEKTEPRLGTDILVHPEAFSELEKLSRDHLIEISDAGLAVEGNIAQPPLKKNSPRNLPPPPIPFPLGVLSLSRSSMTVSVSPTTVSARRTKRHA
jgi:hypothetical protein